MKFVRNQLRGVNGENQLLIDRLYKGMNTDKLPRTQRSNSVDLSTSSKGVKVNFYTNFLSEVYFR